MRLRINRMSEISPGAGADQVMVGVTLPSETSIGDIRMKVHAMGQTEGLNHATVHIRDYYSTVEPSQAPPDGLPRPGMSWPDTYPYTRRLLHLVS